MSDHNSSHAQRSRLLQWLLERTLTTIEARRELDIMHPAARVQELREMGNDIATIRTQDVTECGRKHSVARYVLRKAEA